MNVATPEQLILNIFVPRSSRSWKNRLDGLCVASQIFVPLDFIVTAATLEEEV